MIVMISCLFMLIHAGSAAEKPASKSCPEDMVTIHKTNSCMDKFEFPNKPGALPVVNVSMLEAEKMCGSIGKRLPTEREWELACRGENLLVYPYGNTYSSRVCWDMSGGGSDRLPSGAMKQCLSPSGAMDMTGNVWEWTSDTIKGKASLRGGSYISSAAEASCVFRDWAAQDARGADTGFRCALDVKWKN